MTKDNIYSLGRTLKYCRMYCGGSKGLGGLGLSALCKFHAALLIHGYTLIE